jgi:hypothetical protein
MALSSVLKGLIIVLLLSAATFYYLFRPLYLKEVYLNGKSIKIDRNDYGIATLHVASMEELLYSMGTIVA